jgi:hypothetical protein
MKSRILLALAFLLASGNVLSKMKPCDADCEKSYKVCTTSGKSSEKACMAALEKCRKACVKKEKTPSAP